MKVLYPGIKLLAPGRKLTSLEYFVFVSLFITVNGAATTLIAQEITINPRSNLVLNGNVSLVINNAAFQNNGLFSAGNSTVSFSGHNDTLVSYVSGANSTTFNNLSVSKTAYGVALKSTVIVKNVLTVDGGILYTDSNLILKSDAALTARLAPVPSGSNIIGKAHVERYIPARRAWRLMTAPVTNANTIYDSWQNRGVNVTGLGLLVTGPNPTAAAGNGLDYSTLNTVSMKGFNYSTQQLTNVLNTKVAISPGQSGSADNMGYFVFIRGDRNPINTNVNYFNNTKLTSIGALQTGSQTFSASPIHNRYTLVGNPYASPVDFNNITRTNLVKRFYVWDPSLNIVGGYVMLDDLNNDGNYDKSVAGSSQTKDIQSSQAFFVETNANAAASITFNETSKSGNNNNLMFRPMTPHTPAGIGNGQLRTTLNLLNTNNSTILADGVIAGFDNRYSAAVDLDDALKFSNINENISIVRNNVMLAAERRPALRFEDTLYLKLTTTTKRNYQFIFEADGLEQPGMMGFLEDSFLGTSTLITLSGTTKINFNINAAAPSAAPNRFKIVFRQVAATLPVTISNFRGYRQANHIMVEWKVENEINMTKYDVEKSTDGIIFTRVHTTNVSGLNNNFNRYNWLDINAAAGNNFYRIKSYDNSGIIKYSATIQLSMTISKTGFSIFPNPVTGNVINLLINDMPPGRYHLKLTNNLGQVVFVKTRQINSGSSAEQLNTRTKLAAGTYQLEISGQRDNHYIQKVIVE